METAVRIEEQLPFFSGNNSGNRTAEEEPTDHRYAPVNELDFK